MMWMTDGMHGRADKTSRTYVKGDKVTGRTYAVTLRNPVYGKDFKNGQIAQNNKFGALCKGIAAWVNMAKASAEGSEDRNQYDKFVKAVEQGVGECAMNKAKAKVAEEANKAVDKAAEKAADELSKKIKF